MSVSLRCPTCGTTQSHPGECEACFEGEVRYFCSDHSPGMWIDGPICRTCGARYGETPRTEPVLSPRSKPVVSSPEIRRADTLPPKPTGGVASRPARPSRSAAGGEGTEDATIPPSLRDLLTALAEGRRERHRVEEGWTDPPVDRASRGVPVMGCLFRIVLLIVVLIALFFAGLLGLLRT